MMDSLVREGKVWVDLPERSTSSRVSTVCQFQFLCLGSFSRYAATDLARMAEAGSAARTAPARAAAKPAHFVSSRKIPIHSLDAAPAGGGPGWATCSQEAVPIEVRRIPRV